MLVYFYPVITKLTFFVRKLQGKQETGSCGCDWGKNQISILPLSPYQIIKSFLGVAILIVRTLFLWN